MLHWWSHFGRKSGLTKKNMDRNMSSDPSHWPDVSVAASPLPPTALDPNLPFLSRYFEFLKALARLISRKFFDRLVTARYTLCSPARGDHPFNARSDLYFGSE